MDCMCEKCGELLPTQGELQKHIKSHNVSKTRKTKNVIKKQKGLVPNIETTDTPVKEENTINDDTLQCMECDKQFPSELSWKQHLLQCIKTYKCNRCNELFLDQASLRNHIFVKHPISPATCSQCGMVLSSKSALITHMKTIHRKTVVKKQMCEICSKRFRSASGLRIHMTVHSNERPYGCTQCDKTFKTESHRYIHVQSYHERNCSSCKICGKQFFWKGAVASHVKAVHANKRPHKCRLCDKAFIYPSDLKTHILHFHEKVPYPKRNKEPVRRTFGRKIPGSLNLNAIPVAPTEPLDYEESPDSYDY